MDHEYYLKPGYLYISEEPMIIKTILGSCVSVCLYDRDKKRGGMNHYILPDMPTGAQASVRYGTVSIKRLIWELTHRGSPVQNLEATIAGGAAIRGNKESQLVADRNIQCAIDLVSQAGIKIEAMHTGGFLGRKLIFNIETGALYVTYMNGEFYEKS